MAEKTFVVVDFDDAIKQIEEARRERDAVRCEGAAALRESRFVILGYLRGALGRDDKILRSRIEELRNSLAETLAVAGSP